MANDNPSRATALLAKFEAGTCTPEELAILEQWYSALEADNAVQLSAQQTRQYRQAFLHTFRSSLQQQTVPLPAIRKPVRVMPWLAAACVLLLAGIGYKWLWNTPAPPAVTVKRHVVANTTGHVKRIVLADSSVVWLNAHASLSWMDNTPARRVTLKGEGYFEVRTNAQQPFVVDTRNMQVTVLGTAFNIEAYDAEQTTRVALLNGSVQVNATADSSHRTLLKPGQLATLAAGKPLAIAAADTDRMAGWTNGGFVVNNIPLKDAVARLCERNGCTLEWKNTKDMHKLISASFMRENFEQSLANLCYLSSKQYKRQNNHITIY